MQVSHKAASLREHQTDFQVILILSQSSHCLALKVQCLVVLFYNYFAFWAASCFFFFIIAQLAAQWQRKEASYSLLPRRWTIPEMEKKIVQCCKKNFSSLSVHLYYLICISNGPDVSTSLPTLSHISNTGNLKQTSSHPLVLQSVEWVSTLPLGATGQVVNTHAVYV